MRGKEAHVETLLAVGLASVLGLLFGSFGNVVIHRVPDGASVVAPASACPGCGTPIAPRDNIPVVSWVLLRGRCRHCGEHISARYPLVELAVAAVFALIAWRVGLDWALPGFLLFGWMLFVVSVIDARTRRIPNALTYPLTPALATLMVAAALLNGTPEAALRSVLAGVAGFVFLLALALISPRGMGMGDVKLAAFIGLGLGYLSWAHLVLGLFMAFLFGGFIGMALMLLRLRGRKDLIPFGPYLALGALVALLVGTPLIDAYVATLR
jgi:leader peptidase (prepilin peptidase)/N-methyltransferase